MSTEIENGKVSLRTIFEIIDSFKYNSVNGENVEIIVSPYEVDGKYDDSKRVVTIGQRGGFRRERETFVFDDAEEFDTVILPQILAYFSAEDKMGKWDVTTPEIKEATIKGLCETESGNVVYVATFNPELYEELDKGIERVQEETSYKKAEYNDTDKAWKGILAYVKGRSELIDFTGYSLTEKELEDFYRLVELIAQDGFSDNKVVFTTKLKETMEKIEELFKNPEPLLKNGFTQEFLEKIQKTVSLEQIAKLAINERKFINKFENDNPIVLSKLKFTKVQLGGMKGNYFGSRNHAEVVSKLKAEYEVSDIYNPEEKDLYKKYCDELLGLIEKTKNDKNKVNRATVDLDAPLKARRETTSYTDDYEMFSEIVDLVRLGKKDDEHYELIVEPDTKDPSKVLVRISLFDGVSRTDTYNFEFTDREAFNTRFRVILDRIYADDPNFQTTALYSTDPEVGFRKQSLRITRDKNEILIKDAPEEFVFEKTKIVDINRDEPPTVPPMAEIVNYEDDNKDKKVKEVVENIPNIDYLASMKYFLENSKVISLLNSNETQDIKVNEVYELDNELLRKLSNSEAYSEIHDILAHAAVLLSGKIDKDGKNLEKSKADLAKIYEENKDYLPKEVSEAIESVLSKELNDEEFHSVEVLMAEEAPIFNSYIASVGFFRTSKQENEKDLSYSKLKVNEKLENIKGLIGRASNEELDAMVGRIASGEFEHLTRLDYEYAQLKAFLDISGLSDGKEVSREEINELAKDFPSISENLSSTNYTEERKSVSSFVSRYVFSYLMKDVYGDAVIQHFNEEINARKDIEMFDKEVARIKEEHKEKSLKKENDNDLKIAKQGALEQAVNILDGYIAVKGAEEQAKNIKAQEELNKAEAVTEARVETREIPKPNTQETKTSIEQNRVVSNTPVPPVGPNGPSGPTEPKTDAPRVVVEQVTEAPKAPEPPTGPTGPSGPTEPKVEVQNSVSFTSFEIEDVFNDVIASRKASKKALNDLVIKEGRTYVKESFDLRDLLTEVENIYNKYGLSIIVMKTKGCSKEEEDLISKYRHLGIACTNYYNLTAKRKDLTETEKALRDSVKEDIKTMYAFEKKYMSDERIDELISKIRKQKNTPPADLIFLSELREEKALREKAVRDEQKKIQDLRKEANRAFEKLLPARRKYLKRKGQEDNAKSLEFNEVIPIISSLYDQYGIPDATGALLTRKGAAKEDRAMFNAVYDYYSLCVLYYTETADKEGLSEKDKEFREVAKEHIQLFDAMTAQKLSDEELETSIEKFKNNKDIKPVGVLWLETLEKEKVRRSVEEKVAKDKSLQFTMSPALQAALNIGAEEQAERIIISEGARQEAEKQVIKDGARQEAERQVIKDGARQEAERQVIKDGARQEAERQVLKDGAKKQAENIVISEAAKEEAARIIEEEKRKETDPKKEAAAAALLSGVLAAIKAQENEKEKTEAITDPVPEPVKDNKDTTVSFEQLYEYTKKYKISNTNGPLEIFHKDSGEKYEPIDEAEKRNIEFAFYWGVMVGKNDKYNTEVVNMDYAYSEENKKLFDIMDVHFKESLRKGIDIDFESLERQFINSGVANAEEIFDSLFKTDPLRDYVVKYYKESLGLEDEKEKDKEEVKSESEEYAEYRKLFDLNSEYRLAPVGKSKLNKLKNKEGAIGELEQANRERFIALYKKMTNVNSKEADEEYREKQEQYNRLKRKYDTEFADQIKACNIPEDHILPTYDNKFYELLDETKDRDGMQIVLSDDTKALFEYIALDKERLSRQLTEEEESRMIELVQTNERARILEYARILVNTKGMQVLKLKVLQAIFKERIEEELKEAKWIPKEEEVERTVTPEVPTEAPPVVETPPVEPEEESVKKLNLSKDDREFADYLKLITASRMRELDEEEKNKLAELIATNARAADLERAKEEYSNGKRSEESLKAKQAEYAAQFEEAIKRAILVVEDAKAEDKTDTPSKAKEETIPEDLVPYYEQVKKFEENAAKYSMERVDGVVKFYDRETNIEYIPRNRSERAELEFGQHWMNSVGNDDLIENAKMYKLLHTTYMDSFGKENVNVPELREQFIASGVPNADVCFDNLFADNKADFIRDHIADMEALSQYERENGVITIDFQEMKELLKKYTINGDTGAIVERDNPRIIGPGEYQDDVAIGEWISDKFGEEKDDEPDLSVFEDKAILDKFKNLIKEIKNLMFDSFKFDLNEDREAIIEAMKNYEGGEEFASALIPNDVYMSILIDYVAEKYHMDNPKKTQEYYDYVLSGGKTKDETPVPEQPTEMLRLLPGTEPLRLYPGGGESLTEAAKAEVEHEELPPADGTDSEKLNEEEKENSKTEVVEEFPTETKEYDKENAPEPVRANETVDQALRRLQEYMSATCEFNLGNGVPTAIKLIYENGKPEVGEVVFTSGDVNAEQILFQQKFTQEDIKTKVLPIIASKYVELNNDIEKIPAYSVAGRKNAELFYVGSDEENLFQVSNASQEVIDLAETLMKTELAKKQGLGNNPGLKV